MLLIVLVTVCLCVLAIGAVAKAAQVGLRRFDLDLMDAFLWLGLAERPSGTSPPRKSDIRRRAINRSSGRRRGAWHRTPLGRTRRTVGG